MLLTVKKEALVDGLQKAASVIPSKAGSISLRQVWMKAEGGSLSLMATDSNIEFTGVYEGDIQKEGLVGVNGRNLVDLVRRLPAGDIRMRLESGQGERAENGAENLLVIEQGRRSYKLPASDPNWFRPMEAFPEEGMVRWAGDKFQELIDRVFFCISDDDTAEGINCLYLRSLPGGEARIDVCGLNGHQFALTHFVYDDLASRLPEEGLLIQRKYVIELRKWLADDEIEVNYTGKRFFVRSVRKGKGRESLSFPRALYTYPDYKAFLARLSTPETSLLSMPRKDLLEALDRLSVFNTESERCTYFDLSAQEAILSAQGQDTGSARESMETAYGGDLKRIAFPTKNLMEILTHYQSEQIAMTFTSTEGPCGLGGEEDPDYTVLIMPMKVPTESYYGEE